MDNGKEILDKLSQIQIKQAVTHTKLDAMEVRVKKVEKEADDVDKRVDKHDIYVGGVVIAIAILGALVKYKLI